MSNNKQPQQQPGIKPGTICTIRRCEQPARWIIEIIGHPNSPTRLERPYCHEHAQGEAKLLWDDSPRPYTKIARGPYPTQQPA